MGGGGGDGGYQARQDAQDAQKAAARARLNALFGVAPTGAAPMSGAAPAASAGLQLVGEDGVARGADGAAGGVSAGPAPLYDTAALGSEAEKNRAALDALYGKVRNDAFAAGKRRVDEQHGDAARQLKFELFARGLGGSSVDVDQNATLGRALSQGLTDLGAKADSIASSLKTSDQNTRLQLLQSIDSGMDQGSAVSSALAQMRNNADRAAADATGTSLGDLFAGAGLIYQQGQQRLGRQAGGNWWAQQYQPPGGSGGVRARGGVLTSTGG